MKMRHALLCALILSACGSGAPPTSEHDVGNPGFDAGLEDDGGGAGSDAGLNPYDEDAGQTSTDAGVLHTDAGDPIDAGVSDDAGIVMDAGVSVDAGDLADAGVSADSGLPANDAGAADAGPVQIGGSCMQDSDCSGDTPLCGPDNVCYGFCASSSCDDLPGTECIPLATTDVCLPVCDSDSDCEHFGSGWGCIQMSREGGAAPSYTVCVYVGPCPGYSYVAGPCNISGANTNDCNTGNGSNGACDPTGTYCCAPGF